MQTTTPQAWTWTRIAIVATAGLELLYWLLHLPSLFFRPISEQLPTSALPALLLLLVLVVFPVLAAWGGTLAIQGRDLRRAAWLVAVQPIVYVLGTIAFAIGVLMFGF